MQNFFTCLFFSTLGFCCSVYAQNTPFSGPTTMPYGKVDKADLELKTCDFEKDANAEVLFDRGDIYFDSQYNVMIDHHKRIKIFKDQAKDEANIRIEYYGGNHREMITNVQAETINNNNGVIEITKIDKKLIYTERVDKSRMAVVFQFPNVKEGSIIEYKYTQQNVNVGNFPDWYFQSDLPTRYSAFSCYIPDVLQYKTLLRVHQPFAKNTVKGDGQSREMALANIPSLTAEPYMGATTDNLESILYQLISINPAGRSSIAFSDSWKKVGQELIAMDDFGEQINRRFSGDDVIIAKARSMKTDDEKIDYIFNEVKKSMKWNDNYRFYTNDGTSIAWDKKTGNSAEINLILCHLLMKSGVKAYPMLLSTHKNGKVNPAYPSGFGFNTTAVYIPLDTANYYLIDASSKYSTYKEIPSNLLNSFGLRIDKENEKFDMIFIERTLPVRSIVSINAEIKPGGKMEGTAQIHSFSYNRMDRVEKYKIDGEKKYIDYLRNDDNNLKISSVSFDNMEVDTLPLTQKVAFNLDLTGSDDTYIYFKPNQFSPIGTNPFLSEKRFTDIDFSYRRNYSINGIYKIPPGYKSDVLPKSISLITPDKSISFKRLIVEQDGQILVRYTIDYKKSIFFKEDYADIREFYKKMHEMLNEQVVLKKS